MKDTITRFLRYVARETNTIGLEQRLQDKAWDEAVEFIQDNSHRGCDFHNSLEGIRRKVFSQAPKEGLLLEFGVNRGKSIHLFSSLLMLMDDPRTIFGFDNFAGLTEDWTGMGRNDGHVVRKKHFDLGGRAPEVDNNVKLVVGDIEDTLNPFLESHREESIAFIHIDTDTYTPCRLILEKCKPFLSDGSVVLFDQLLGYPSYRSHEFAALHETLARAEYEFIGFGIAQERANLVKAAIQYNKI